MYIQDRPTLWPGHPLDVGREVEGGSPMPTGWGQTSGSYSLCLYFPGSPGGAGTRTTVISKRVCAWLGLASWGGLRRWCFSEELWVWGMEGKTGVPRKGFLEEEMAEGVLGGIVGMFQRRNHRHCQAKRKVGSGLGGGEPVSPSLAGRGSPAYLPVRAHPCVCTCACVRVCPGLPGPSAWHLPLGGSVCGHSSDVPARSLLPSPVLLPSC